MIEQDTTLTAAEWRVMECLWERSPLLGRELVERMRELCGWSRSTTLTLLSRMEAKGAITASAGAGKKAFSPLIRREDMALRETKDFLSRVYKGSLSMMVSAFTRKESLSEEELRELHAILKELEAGRDA